MWGGGLVGPISVGWGVGGAHQCGVGGGAHQCGVGWEGRGPSVWGGVGG